MISKQNNRFIIYKATEIVCVILSLLLILYNQEGQRNKVLAYGVLIFNLATIIKVKNNLFLFVIFCSIAYCNYSICIVNHIHYLEMYFTQYSYTEIGALGLNILYAFNALLFLFSPHIEKKQKSELSLIKHNRENTVIVGGSLFILAVIFFVGFSRPDMIGERGTPSAIYEYSIVFLIVALYYAGKNKSLIITIIAVAVAFAGQNFIFGGRITGLQLLTMLLLALMIDNVKLRNLLPVSIVLFVILSAIGQLRGSLFSNGLDVDNVLSNLSEREYSLDTAYSSYFTSMTFLDELRVTSSADRVYLFGRWILSMLLGGSVRDSNLAQYTLSTHLHYYGGVLPYFGYFYLGTFGVLLLSLWLRFLIHVTSKTDENSSGLHRHIVLYFAATTLRWYLYSPSQLFRGIALLAIVYSLCLLIDRSMKKRAIEKEIRIRKTQ